MLIVMRHGAAEDEILRVVATIEEMGYQARPMPGKQRTTVGLVGNDGRVDGSRLAALPGVQEILHVTKPSPFCLMDEVDAPLDDSNVGRFTRLLDEFKSDTQFLVITHNPRTMQAADAVYGVTMQEPGVSTVVGVKLGEREHA